MMLGVVVGWIGVSEDFGLVTAGCVVLSLLYSHPVARWKARPGLDLAVNMVGYGGATTLAGLLAGAAATNGLAASSGTALAPAAWWLVGGFALLFGSFYPLTQIYQIAEDRRRGDRTLATALGTERALGLAVALGGLATVCLLTAVARNHTVTAAPAEPATVQIRALALVIWPLAAALAAWLGHLTWWLLRVHGTRNVDHERGMYRALALWAIVDVALLVSWHLASRA
jgi:4-hydroxybenzoate polyprenyltransferase